MRDIDYVSLDVAKRLKELGFNDMCDSLYGTAVMHKGVHISFDEECDLKDEGRADEIEYVDGGEIIDMYNQNNEEDGSYCYSRPTINHTLNWLRNREGLHVNAVPEYVAEEECVLWKFIIYSIEENKVANLGSDEINYPNYFFAMNEGLLMALDILKQRKEKE